MHVRTGWVGPDFSARQGLPTGKLNCLYSKDCQTSSDKSAVCVNDPSSATITPCDYTYATDNIKCRCMAAGERLRLRACAARWLPST